MVHHTPYPAYVHSIYICRYVSVYLSPQKRVRYHMHAAPKSNHVRRLQLDTLLVHTYIYNIYLLCRSSPIIPRPPRKAYSFLC